jgi:predicted lipid-binding transport protein (Tim44 family)
MLRGRYAKLFAIALILLMAVALVVPAVGLARAGGGHTSNPGHSSGGGFSGGSSGGGGGGGGVGSFLGGAAVGSALSGGSSSGGGCGTFIVIVIIIVIAYFVITRFFKSNGTTPPPGAMPDYGAMNQPAQGGGPVGFDQLKAEDPNFSEQAFYGRVNEMFLAIQKAWEARNMEPARRFLAEQQFTVLADGVGEYVRNGQINKLDSIHIDHVVPVSVTREGDSDYVKVMITATVIDYTIDERTGQIVNPGVLGDGKTPKTFDEYWTLVRKVGAQTKSDATIKKCPNCGGPVTDGNYVKCAYCGTMMNDPALDWVLLRIEQP